VDTSSLLAITARLDASDALVNATCSSDASRRASSSCVSTGVEPLQAPPALNTTAAISNFTAARPVRARGRSDAAQQEGHMERSPATTLPGGTGESPEDFLKIP
jgi:hypothetical protein